MHLPSDGSPLAYEKLCLLSAFFLILVPEDNLILFAVS